MDKKQIEIKEFFDGWGRYKKILLNNYMHHNEIFSEVSNLLNQHISNDTSTLKFLDLGCGDAYFTSKLVNKITSCEYVGVDLSTTALAESVKNFSTTNHQTQFIEDDLNNALDEFISQKKKFDVIFSSFCIHHFVDNNKNALLSKIKQSLAPGGIFIYIDVFRFDNQSREEYMSDTMNTFYKKLVTFEAYELAQSKHHIENFDYPETISHTKKILKESGFDNVTLQYSIKHYSIFTCTN